MKASLYFLTLMLLLTSCITQNRIDRKCHKAKTRYEIAAHKWGCPIANDSTIVHSLEIIKDTTIYVPVPGQSVHDSIQVIITEGIMNSPVSALETTYANSKAWVVDGHLKHTLLQKTSVIPVTIPGAIHTSATTSVNTIKVPYYIDRPIPKPFSWWQKLFLWTGVITWWVVFGFLIFKFKNFSIL